MREKAKLLNRIRRIRGQVNAIEQAVESEADGTEVLHTIAALRGAVQGLMAHVIEGHIREHVMDPTEQPSPGQLEAAQELIDVINAYLK